MKVRSKKKVLRVNREAITDRREMIQRAPQNLRSLPEISIRFVPQSDEGGSGWRSKDQRRNRWAGRAVVVRVLGSDDHERGGEQRHQINSRQKTSVRHDVGEALGSTTVWLTTQLGFRRLKELRPGSKRQQPRGAGQERGGRGRCSISGRTGPCRARGSHEGIRRTSVAVQWGSTMDASEESPTRRLILRVSSLSVDTEHWTCTFQIRGRGRPDGLVSYTRVLRSSEDSAKRERRKKAWEIDVRHRSKGSWVNASTWR